MPTVKPTPEPISEPEDSGQSSRAPNYEYLPRSLSALCKTFEEEKKRRYGDRIREVEHGSFTPLVFSSCGGMGLETGAALRKLASMAAEKKQEPYHQTITLDCA